MRKAHWAIDRVTRDMPARFAFNTAIAAVMELVNKIYRERESVPPDLFRIAIARGSGSSLRPPPRRRGLRVDDGRRAWEQPGPRRTRPC